MLKKKKNKPNRNPKQTERKPKKQVVLTKSA